MTFAVVPACGHSTRMGRPKLALPLVVGRSVIEQVVLTLRSGGVEVVLVVIAPHVPELESLASAAGAEVLRLAEPTADMRTTVELGLGAIERRYQPAPSDSWLLAPADHPAFTSTTVRRLLATAQHDAERSILVPTYRRERGHPALLRWRCVAGIRSLPREQGVNAYLRSLGDAVVELPVDDPGILVNLDTPEDYASLTKSLQK